MVGSKVVRYLIPMVLVIIAGCGGGEDDTTMVTGLSQGRWGHTAMLLEDGRVLVVGGQGTPTLKFNTAEIFDPNADSWSSAGSMVEKRGTGHTATMLADGRVLVTGETDDGSAEIYDPSTGQWSAAGVMLESRVLHTTTLLADGRVLVAGGGSPPRAVREYNSAEIYDPSTGQWSPTGDMQNKHSADSAILLQDGRVLVVGEYLAEVYDPSAGTWSPAGKPLRERTRGYPLTMLEDGRILITGGEIQQGGWTGLTVPVANVDIYDPSDGSWSAASPMEKGHKLHTATRLPDGRVLVVGSRQMDLYDPATNTWFIAGELIQMRGEFYTATQLNDGRILVVGGKGDTEEGDRGLTFVETYDPSTFVPKD